MGAQTQTETPRLVGGRYELEALVGKGGIGEVWRARHLALNSLVAIKFLQLASAQKESAQRRFTTEAQVTAQLKTPHAVQVFDFGVTDEGQPYLVMELLEGETLGRRLERVRRLNVDDAVRLLGQAARALHRAHALGIVHRDFKPDNIVISADDEGLDQVKVLDFGVAKLVGALEEGVELDASAPGHAGAAPSFTRTGAVLGTPLYMAPEQIRNPSDVDLKADIWAFGVVAFECLTGRPPFTGASLGELFERIQGSLHPSAAFLEPSVPPGFDAWFDTACAADPARRFMNASVAWKQLTVALDANNNERSGSFPGLDHHEMHSGERRIVVAPGEERTDATAPTLEGERGELLTRSYSDEFHSLRRIPKEALSRTSGEPPTTSLGARSRGARGGRRAWIPAAILGVVAAGGLVAWRASVRHAEPDVTLPARATPPVRSTPGNPLPVPLTTAVQPAPAPAAVTGAPTLADSTAPQPSSSSSSHGAARPTSPATRPAPVGAPAPRAATEPVTAAPPPPTATEPSHAPPPPAPTALDPGSYR